MGSLIRQDGAPGSCRKLVAPDGEATGRAAWHGPLQLQMERHERLKAKDAMTGDA